MHAGTRVVLVEYDTNSVDISRYLGLHQRYAQYYIWVPLTVPLYQFDGRCIGSFPEAAPESKEQILERASDLAAGLCLYMAQNAPQRVGEAAGLARRCVDDPIWLNAMLMRDYGKPLTSTSTPTPSWQILPGQLPGSPASPLAPAQRSEELSLAGSAEA